MYKYLVIVSLFALSSCTLGMKEEKTPAPEPTPIVQNTPQPSETSKNPLVSLNYTLREGSPTGTIIETTKEDVAKANNLYKSDAAYKPFEVTLGTNSVIPGFEAGIAALKKGEKSTIMVLPKDGYGEASIVRTVRESEVAPEFMLTTDRTRFEDTIVETVERKVLGEQGQTLVVGQTLTGGAYVVAKVTKIDGDKITLTIDNKDHPFYGKKLAVGLKATKENITFTIKELFATGITLMVANGNSPFTGKAFVVGASALLPASPEGKSPGEMRVMALSGEVVTVSLPNTHPLAGKTLYFEVEILDIR